MDVEQLYFRWVEEVGRGQWLHIVAKETPGCAKGFAGAVEAFLQVGFDEETARQRAAGYCAKLLADVLCTGSHGASLVSDLQEARVMRVAMALVLEGRGSSEELRNELGKKYPELLSSIDENRAFLRTCRFTQRSLWEIWEHNRG